MLNNDDEILNIEFEEVVLNSLQDGSDSGKKTINNPEQLYIFPVLRRPFFPGMASPVVIETGSSYEMLKIIANSDQKYVGLVLTLSENLDTKKIQFSDLHTVGVMGRILRIIPMEQGGAQVILNMEKRITILNPIEEKPHLIAKVKVHEDVYTFTKELKAYAISIISTIKELLKLNPLFKEELQIFLGHSDFTEPGKLADFAVALTTASRQDLQEVLETFDILIRIEKALVLLKKELDISQLQNSINQKIDASINKTQKDFFLREQLKTIRKELGIEREDKVLDREKFEARLKERIVPADVMKVIQDELEKLSVLEIQSSEYGVVRNYLDWLTITPWGILSPDCHDVAYAEKILAEDHYGLEDIKQRVLELIGVGKLVGSVRGTIICLVGPPGVGKTSIGKSIARALNRKFYRLSVGGMRDEAEIKGHRRTYIGSMPGKMIQALKYCQTMNPVIMLDEVDKMGRSYHGDPASALLEVLDPEQNADFLDHYLDVRCNLSNVMFIVTANMLDTIPEPLLDRMDVLRLSGYIMQEKLEIANKYLIPRNRKEFGLKVSQVSFSKESLRSIVNGYAREAGVRTLENVIKNILRKIALKIVREQESSEIKKLPYSPSKYSLSNQNLVEYLGKPKFNSDRFYDVTPIGVSTGLAWTSHGGATLYIESITVFAEKTGMKLTGQAGDVMKESAEIAWTYLNSSIKKYAPKKAFFENSLVHIHIPEGATPKDGPSAGITMVSSLLSLLLDKPILENLGMTGELTLTGRILPIGGVKEKVVAAQRSGLKTLIFPKDNRRDFEELPDYVRKGIDVHFVEHFDEVFTILFPKSLKGLKNV